MVKNIISYILSFIMVALIITIVAVSFLQNKVLNEDYWKIQMEQNNYYEKLEDTVNDGFENYIMQSGMDSSVFEGIYDLDKVKEDTNSIVHAILNNEEFKIDAYTNLADGYIEKPFSLPVLKARIDALLQKQDTFEYKNVCVNFKSYTAKIDGKMIDINAKELEILKYLLDNAGIALSRAQILDHVWKESEDVPYDRVIDVYIKELRKKLGLDCITTIRNVGYKLEKSWKT